MVVRAALMALAVAAAKAAVVTDVFRQGGVVGEADAYVGVARRNPRVKFLFILALHTEDRPGGRGARPSPENS